MVMVMVVRLKWLEIMVYGVRAELGLLLVIPFLLDGLDIDEQKFVQAKRACKCTIHNR
jgi:hypothetical protein